MAIAFPQQEELFESQNLLFRFSFFISLEILCPCLILFFFMPNFIKEKCMQQLFMCMDAWELAGKGDGHILWVRISSKPDTGEATSASGTSRSNSELLGCPAGHPDF